ncbi:MAG: HAD family phosphatase [Candidatus Nealsonbacteria bacterium]|nr:HAD family phosphatase [Candidatus Nealsonbacteria bacterium]
MKIEGIGLDLEGNLVDIEFVHHTSHLEILREWGVPLSFDEALKLIPCFIGGPDEKVAEAAVKSSKERTGEDHDVAEYLKEKRARYKKYLPQVPMVLRPGVELSIRWLRSNGLEVVVGSVTNTDQARVIVERAGLINIIKKDNFIFREDVTHPKPDGEIWIKGAGKLGIKPEGMAIFGDSPGDIKSARNAGCPFGIAMPVFNKPELMIRLINEGADRIFMDWREINFPALFENLNQELQSKIRHF